MLPAIRVRDLSKRYQLGLQDAAEGSFRETLVNFAKAPLRRLRHLGGASAEADTFWALNEVSFDVHPGEVIGVIGRNGAGKSTLLKILSRITAPTAGRVELRGRVASLLEVGTGFHPDLTGRENIYLNGAILGMPRADLRRKFDAIVDFAEVARFVDTPVKHYSSGMYLRLAFSVAAHLDGEILLVDEVLAVGDVAFQQKCLGKMKDVSRGGRTVVFVTHNMMAASALCERGILIDGGRVRVNAGIQDAIKEYLSDTSAACGSRDVAALPRQDGRGEVVKVTRIDARPMRDPRGFQYGESIRFRIHVQAAGTLSSLYIGAGIDDIHGHRVASFDSNHVDFEFCIEAGRAYEFELTIPQPYLNPGRYFLSVSLFSGLTFYDLLLHATSFDVLPIRSDTGEYFEPLSGSGALGVPYDWTPASTDAAREVG